MVNLVKVLTWVNVVPVDMVRGSNRNGSGSPKILDVDMNRERRFAAQNTDVCVVSLALGNTFQFVARNKRGLIL